MTIERILNATAPQIEKGGTAPSQSHPSGVGGGANPVGKSAFASLLSAMTDGGVGIAEAADADTLLAPYPAQALELPAPDSEPAPDSVAVGVQPSESLRPEAAGLAWGIPGETGAGLPNARPDAAIDSTTAMRRHGTGATLQEPVQDGSGQEPDAASVSGPVASPLKPGQLPAGPHDGPLVATMSEGATEPASHRRRGAPGLAGTIRADWRAATAATAASAERAAFTIAPWSDVASGGFRAFGALRGSDRASGREMFLPLDGAAAGSVASSGYSTQLASGAAPTATAYAPMAPSASSEVAHKVHYWVTRGVQTAELQLDALGGSAVDVSITLQGKEALVDFRSDQPEARRVLQEAMPQLRDMLRAEGLQLAGGFVGSSAQQKERDPRRDGHHREPDRSAVLSVSAADVSRTGRSEAAATHSLDVFV